jgi:type I restriction enzyme S subunit
MIGNLKPYAEYKESGSKWLGAVPAKWEVRNLRTLISKRAERDRADLPLLSVAREKGVFVRSLTDADENHNVIPEDLSNYKVARVGNLVINKMKAWQGSMGIAPCDGIVSPAYYVFDFRIANHAFGQRLLRSKPYVAHFGQASDGVRVGQWDLSIPGMRQIPVLVPSPDEQTAIVRFLDWANGRLERAIRAKRKVIALLNEQKQAIIHHAVTRGLDSSAPLKPSGIPWLGDIPQHWEVRRLKSLVMESVAGPYGSSLTKSMYTKVGYRVYGQQQVIPDNFTVGDYYISTEQFGLMRRYQVFAGDVLVSVMGTVGRVAVVPDGAEPGIINPRLVRYQPDMTVVRPRWLQITMQDCVAQTQLSEASKGTTMDGLNMRILGKLLLLKPPLTEQDAILEYVAKERQPFITAISRLEREIELLRENRTRLVADVVTGKLDVRAAAKLPEETYEPQLLDDADALTEGDEETEDADLDAVTQETEA